MVGEMEQFVGEMQHFVGETKQFVGEMKQMDGEVKQNVLGRCPEGKMQYTLMDVRPMMTILDISSLKLILNIFLNF